MLIVNTDEFTKRNLTKVGYTVSPLDDGSLERYTVHQVAMATLTRGALEETGLSQEGRRAGEEHVRPGPAVVDVPPAHRGHGAVPAREVREAARPGRGERAGVQGRARLRRDHRVVRRDLRGRAGPAARGHVPADHRQHRAGLRDRGGRAGHRPAGVPRLVPDHAGQRHPARAEQAQGLRRHDLPGRGRDRRRRRRAGRGVRRRAGRDHDVRAPGSRSRARRSAWPSRWSCRCW